MTVVRRRSSVLPLFLLLACGQPDPGSAAGGAGAAGPPKPPTGHVLATVNGAPIYMEDVLLELRRAGHGEDVDAAALRNVLDEVIADELVYQRAVELGLDADPAYRDELRKMEAGLNAFKRDKLGKLFFHDQVMARAEPTDAEVKQYYEANADALASELHVWQIMFKGDEPAAKKALADVQSGTPFEEVAARQFPAIPDGARKPWDLGFVSWKKIPAAWRDVVFDLPKGEVSGLIAGPSQRFWILKIVDKRTNPSISLETAAPLVRATLKAQRIDDVRASMAKELRDEARIEYNETPPPVPEPEDD